MIQSKGQYKTVSVVISTRKKDEAYIEHIKKTSANPWIEVLVYENNGEYSLAEIYNQGLAAAANPLVVFCHDDLIFNTDAWCSKITKRFRQSDYGIIGVAGTDKLLNGCWWSDNKSMYGVVNHIQNGKRHTNHFSDGLGANVKQVVTLDGLFMAVNKDRIKDEFDTSFPGFHFYGIPFCLNNHLAGVKVGVVTDIRLTHKSIGIPNEQWYQNKQLFEQIYKNELPCVL